MLKTVKFGGSSLADAQHFKKVAEIIRADEGRRYVVVSAPGKRFAQDMDPNCMPAEIRESEYPKQDYHTLYIGEIVEVLEKE